MNINIDYNEECGKVTIHSENHLDPIELLGVLSIANQTVHEHIKMKSDIKQ